MERYDLYDPHYNAEGKNLEQITKEHEDWKNFFEVVSKQSKPAVTRIIKNLAYDKKRIESYTYNKATNLVAWDNFSLEVFKLAKKLAYAKTEEQIEEYEDELMMKIESLYDDVVLKEYKTTRETALHRIGILMLTEEDNKVFSVLRKNLYEYIPEVKTAVLKPEKYVDKINNADTKRAIRENRKERIF